MMDTVGFETFLTVVRAQSLSKAAEELHLAQTTVSQRLKVLEQEIGLMLIERGKGIKQIRLTPAGEEFFKLAEQWSLIWKEAQLLQAHGPKLSLKVGSVNSMITFVLPPVFRALNEHLIPINLRIHSAHTTELYSEIEKQQIDVAFVTRNLVHPNVIVKQCFKSPMVVLRPTKTSGMAKGVVNPGELKSDHELFMPWGLEYETWHDYWWNPINPSKIKLDCPHILLSLLQDPLQWAIVPEIIATAATEISHYSISYLTDPPPPFTCYKLTHNHPTSLTRKALEIFDRCFQSLVH